MDTYSKWATAKRYTTKTPITAAELLNDRVLPFFASQEMGIIRMLRDRGTEYCGKLETHDYELYLEELQTDLDAWLHEYNTERTHQGKMCCGRTPMQTLLDGKAIWMEKVGQLN